LTNEGKIEAVCLTRFGLDGAAGDAILGDGTTTCQGHEQQKENLLRSKCVKTMVEVSDTPLRSLSKP
jgi:hypothetical protein